MIAVVRKSLRQKLLVVVMERDRKVELIDLAVQKLIQDNRRNNNKSQEEAEAEAEAEAEEGVFGFLKTTNKKEGEEDDDEAEYQLALSQLLSASHHQFEMVNGNEVLKQSNASILPAPAIQKTESNEKVDAVKEDGKGNGSETSDEIVKELKKVKRQNFVTHCLLSVMIVVTVAWQLSEVSLIMKVKDGINHPFRSFGSMLKGMLKVPNMNNGEEGDNNKQHQQSHESPSFPSFVPEMHQVDVPSQGLNNGKE